MSELNRRTIVVDADDQLAIAPLTEADRDAYVDVAWRNRLDLENAYMLVGLDSRNNLHTEFDDELERIAEGGCSFGIRLRGQLIGQIMFSEQPSDRGMEPTIDLWIDRRHRRSGVAERVIRTLAAAAFEDDPGLPNIRMMVGEHNVAMKGLAAKVGARSEGLDEVEELEVWRLHRG